MKKLLKILEPLRMSNTYKYSHYSSEGYLIISNYVIMSDRYYGRKPRIMRDRYK